MGVNTYTYEYLFRNLDGTNLEGESDKEDGKGPAVVEILEARSKATQWWDTFFLALCAFGVFIDPLFCYINVIEEDHMCFSYDSKLVLAYTGLRMAIGIFYFIDIIIFCKKRRVKKDGACCWKPKTDHQKSIVLALKQVIKRWYLLLLPILPSILVALPIPEVREAPICTNFYMELWSTFTKSHRALLLHNAN